MTRLTEGEGVPEATLNEEAPFLMAIDSVLAASTVEAAFAAVEAVAASAAAAATAAEQTPVASASNKAASDATATAPADEAKTRSSMASLFATVAAWPAKPISAADSTPISSAAAANSAATAAAAAEAKAAAEVKKSPLKGVPGPLVKGLGRSCLDVPFGLAWWGPAFCVRPIVKGQLRELVKADAKLVSPLQN
jgi:pyruvate/2-oxoglutarate dehydrogenase complex dihydrolipoamide acyltransferase (E2) component